MMIGLWWWWFLGNYANTKYTSSVYGMVNVCPRTVMNLLQKRKHHPKQYNNYSKTCLFIKLTLVRDIHCFNCQFNFNFHCKSSTLQKTLLKALTPPLNCIIMKWVPLNMAPHPYTQWTTAVASLLSLPLHWKLVYYITHNNFAMEIPFRKVSHAVTGWQAKVCRIHPTK